MGFARHNMGSDVTVFTPEHEWLSEVMVDARGAGGGLGVIIGVKPGFPGIRRKMRELMSLKNFMQSDAVALLDMGEKEKAREEKWQASIDEVEEANDTVGFRAGPTSQIREALTMSHIPRDIQAAVMDELQAHWREMGR